MGPRIILLFSGKRKSGKDYITDKLQEIFGDNVCYILKISQPIKSHWASMLNLDLKALLGDGEYKEKYRLEMIKWSEDMRDKDYGCFCRVACEAAKQVPVWIVSDIRRRTDLKWFRENYGEKIKTVKVVADDDVRKERGWVYTAGIDDAQSECDLDGVSQWDFIINNGDSTEPLEQKTSALINEIKAVLS